MSRDEARVPKPGGLVGGVVGVVSYLNVSIACSEECCKQYNKNGYGPAFACQGVHYCPAWWLVHGETYDTHTKTTAA